MVNDSRLKRAKLNIVFSLGSQFVVLLCNLIIPNLLIRSFGSGAYGATTSITRFLSFIALMEGGIGGVARAALYKPLADNDMQRISEIVSEMKKFFRMIACFFSVYALALACSFKYISNADFEWTFTFGLVLAISITTFAQYYIGITYAVLMNAAQKLYISSMLSIFSWILTMIFVIFLTHGGYSLVVVKLASSVAFLLHPLGSWLYVRKHFNLVRCDTKGKNYLSQKWDGLGQHLAYHLHFQTDIAVLTIFTNLTSVAVYSVYNMIVSYMQNIIGSFTAGMEAMFGDMLAKKEYDSLKKSFDYYETMLSVIAVVLFSVTAVMIIPFVELYTAGVADASYKEPVFAVIFVLASVLYCLRLPYHELTIAAGHFKQTNKAAYGEAAINMILSIVLLRRFGLCGVAAATVIATGFRFLYYVFYLSKNIVYRKKRLFVKRILVNAVSFMTILFAGKAFLHYVEITNYFYWVFYAAIVTLFAGSMIMAFQMLFYREDMMKVMKKCLSKGR